jgi:hypothetical protein
MSKTSSTRTLCPTCNRQVTTTDIENGTGILRAHVAHRGFPCTGAGQRVALAVKL